MTRTAMLEKGAPTVDMHEPAGRAATGRDGRRRGPAAEPTGGGGPPPPPRFS
jgi:hypothetical protein